MNKLKKLMRYRVDMADYMVLTAIFLGALYWALESLLNVFSPDEISFYEQIFGPNISEIWPRLIVFCLFLMFGSHVQFTINERKKAAEALRESEEKYRTILESIEAADAEAAAGRALPTPELNEVLREAVTAHAPPVVRGRRIRLRYAHQGGRRPPVIVVHGSQVGRLPAHYRRYLMNTFRKAFRLQGTPIRLELKQGDNPFAGRRNLLTPRQQRKRERLLKHVKRRR